MSDWFCYKCDGNMKDADICPYCGNGRYESDNNPTVFHYANARKIFNNTQSRTHKRKKVFTDTEKLMFGLYPKAYKDILKLKVFGKMK